MVEEERADAEAHHGGVEGEEEGDGADRDGVQHAAIRVARPEGREEVREGAGEGQEGE